MQRLPVSISLGIRCSKGKAYAYRATLLYCKTRDRDRFRLLAPRSPWRQQISVVIQRHLSLLLHISRWAALRAALPGSKSFTPRTQPTRQLKLQGCQAGLPIRASSGTPAAVKNVTKGSRVASLIHLSLAAVTAAIAGSSVLRASPCMWSRQMVGVSRRRSRTTPSKSCTTSELK
jgi:hypothetical protein